MLSLTLSFHSHDSLYSFGLYILMAYMVKVYIVVSSSFCSHPSSDFTIHRSSAAMSLQFSEAVSLQFSEAISLQSVKQ